MTIYELANRLDSSTSFVDSFAGRPEFQEFITYEDRANSRRFHVCPKFKKVLAGFLTKRIRGRCATKYRIKYLHWINTNFECLS